jgi:hypothetical protein
MISLLRFPASRPMRLFDVASSKNLADNARFSTRYTERYIQPLSASLGALPAAQLPFPAHCGGCW